jgi:hypothetical protein
MEIKEIEENVRALKDVELNFTTDYINRNFSLHRSVLDLSNKFLLVSALDTLLQKLSMHFANSNTFKYLIFQNCMLNAESLIKILKTILKANHTLAFKTLDIGNNQISLGYKEGKFINRALAKAGRHKAKSLNLQGNFLSKAEFFDGLFIENLPLLELNLYDTHLGPDTLSLLSETISSNAHIQKLDMAFNSAAFANIEVLAEFANSIGSNEYITELNLSGNFSLGNRQRLLTLLLGFKGNKTLQALKLGSCNLKDKGLFLISKILLALLPVCSLDLSNNSITNLGLRNFLKRLPITLNDVDLSYNSFTDDKVLTAVGNLLKHSRTIRSLKLSNSIELTSVSDNAIQALTEGLVTNVSLGDLFCEGVKLRDDPDTFCRIIGEAITNRRLALNYKISAVNCLEEASSISSTVMMSSNGSYSRTPTSFALPEQLFTTTQKKSCNLSSPRPDSKHFKF